MSTVAHSRELRQLLVFPTPGSYAGFMLTCLEVGELAPGSELHQECLGRVFIPRSNPRELLIPLRGERGAVQQAVHVAIANGAEARDYRAIDGSKHEAFTADRLWRAVRLQSLPMDGLKPPHLLVALWNMNTEGLSQLCRTVWNLSPRTIEIAFIQQAGRTQPRYLLRIGGLRHADAFHALCASKSSSLEVEVYVPIKSDRQEPRFYTKWGYRHPIPGLDKLAELHRELVLLRPRPDSKKLDAEWLTFAEGEVNFFRRAYEFAELDIGLRETPLVEMKEETQPQTVPLELALVPRPKMGPTRIWQLDRQIDRQRRTLMDLEQQRARLAAGEVEEAYFAYRFEQQRDGELNPRLIRLMQQRLGTLSNYDYAFCQPKRGKPYHLVVANRTQRQVGYSLQSADRTYYQPAHWRRWGLNLYLPLHTELAPRIDSNDVLPLLQRIVEQSDQQDDSQLSPGASMECAAVLWDPGRDGEIDATLVKQVVPLLSQFRLLNSFQRNTAGQVAAATREQLRRDLEGVQGQVDGQLDGLTRLLLEHVAQRTEKLQTSYGQLETALQAAEKLVDVVAPHVEKVRQLVLKLPTDWITFVNEVLETHRQVVDPEIQSLAELRQQLTVSRRTLRALASNGRDLAAEAQQQRNRVQGQLDECAAAMEEGRQQDQQLESLSQRATQVLAEIATLHDKLHDRLRQVQQLNAEADRMEQDVRDIDKREAEAQQRVEKARVLYRNFQQRAAEVENLSQEVAAREQALLKRTADMARQNEQHKARVLQIAEQLKRIEQHLLTQAERSEDIERTSSELQQQLDLVDAQASAVELWERHQQQWEGYIENQQGLAAQRLDDVNRSLEELEQRDRGLETVKQHIAEARQLVGKAEALLKRKKE